MNETQAWPSEASLLSAKPNLEISWREECSYLLAQARTASDARALLRRAHKISQTYPDELEAQVFYGTLLNISGLRAEVFETWVRIHERFPDSSVALENRILWLARRQGFDEARGLIETHRPLGALSLDHLLERANLLFRIREFAQANATFEEAARRFPDEARVRLLFATRLKQQGRAVQARECLEPMLALPSPHKTAAAVAEQLDIALSTMKRLAPRRLENGENSLAVAVACLLSKFHHRKPRALPGNHVGATALITGSLAPGGAERQLVRTAKLLSEAMTTGTEVRGITINGPIHVVVRSLAREEDRDFFLHEFGDQPVRVWEADEMTAARLTLDDVPDPDVLSLLPLVSAPIGYGIARLVAWFRREKIDGAYIWQDGAILLAAVAALLAGVPRIVLGLRGMPPNLRVHRLRPEYQDLYKGLISIPGVTLVSNTEAAATAYCDWLGCSPARFQVVHNGLSPLDSEPGPGEFEQWEAFDRRTAGAAQTIGGVFRMDSDKRPLMWIDFAREYLKSHPTARFIVIGKGLLWAQVKQRASEYGLADRILFVGRSGAIGFWLSKMDSFLLLSRFEGVPNVLIEAQLAGLGVVSTPAGGSSETFVEGVTGLSTGTVEHLDMQAVGAKVDNVIAMSRARPDFSAMTRRRAERNFSPAAMLERTALILAGADPAVLQAPIRNISFRSAWNDSVPLAKKFVRFVQSGARSRFERQRSAQGSQN